MPAKFIISKCMTSPKNRQDPSPFGPSRNYRRYFANAHSRGNDRFVHRGCDSQLLPLLSAKSPWNLAIRLLLLLSALLLSPPRIHTEGGQSRASSLTGGKPIRPRLLIKSITRWGRGREGGAPIGKHDSICLTPGLINYSVATQVQRARARCAL